LRWLSLIALKLFQKPMALAARYLAQSARRIVTL
jgi:hypothetical protein